MWNITDEELQNFEGQEGSDLAPWRTQPFSVINKDNFTFEFVNNSNCTIIYSTTVYTKILIFPGISSVTKLPIMYDSPPKPGQLGLGIRGSKAIVKKVNLLEKYEVSYKHLLFSSAIYHLHRKYYRLTSS